MSNIKKILRDTCILAALMVFCVFTISILWVGMTSEIMLVLRLFCLSLVIATLNFFMDEYTTFSILGSYIAKYFIATAVVMLFGFMVGWFYKSNFWMAFIYVGIVLVLAYLIDAFITRKDIEYINLKLKERAHGGDSADSGS